MEYRISELLDCLGEVDLDIRPDTDASADRVKELTMEKIHKNQKREPKRGFRGLGALAKAAVIAAALISLALPVMAATGFSFTDWLKENPKKTGEYDTDLSLGSAGKAWEASGWTVELTPEAISATGLTVNCTHWTNEAAPTLTGSLAADESYWLEKWTGEDYQKLPAPQTAVPAGKTLQVQKDAAVRWTVNWEKTYGALEDGTYRLGKNFVYTSDDGKTETVPMYVKFRVYKQDMASAVRQCREMLEALRNQDSYHLLHTSYTQDRGEQYEFAYYTTEFWKSGNDFMEERTYYGKDGSIAVHDGYLLRDGKGYSLTWTGDNVLTPLESWETAEFVDRENMEFGWNMGFEIWDNSVGVVSVDEKGIQIIQKNTHADGRPATVWALTFHQDENGKLTGAKYDSVPSETFSPDQAVTWFKLEILDTDPAESQKAIAAQAVDKPLSFSWEQDQAKYAGDQNAKVEGFQNTTAKPVADASAAVAAAKNECTLEFQNTAVVRFDEAARMWKVELGSSANSDVGQTVYLTEDGITKLVVTK